jgi:AhpD family alkylhydroperoxidase
MIGRHLFSQAAARQVRFVRPVVGRSSPTPTSEVGRHIEQEIRLMVPPLLAHTPAPQVLSACWVLVRETLLATGASDRITKEAVAAAVSSANACPYCLEMHAIGVRGLGNQADAEAIAADDHEQVADPALRQVVQWARAIHRRDETHPEPVPLTPEARAELLGVAVAFHYLTRMVNIYLPNYLLPPALRGGARAQVKGRIAKMMGPMLSRRGAPATSIDLLPDAPLPEDCVWAAASPHVGAAVARTTAAFEAAGETALSLPVRELLLEHLTKWRGEEMPLTRAWLDPAVAPLSEKDRPAGRLVLLTAFASYQLLPKDVQDVQAAGAGDAELVAATAWASYTTARRIASWHPAPLGAAG